MKLAGPNSSKTSSRNTTGIYLSQTYKNYLGFTSRTERK